MEDAVIGEPTLALVPHPSAIVRLSAELRAENGVPITVELSDTTMQLSFCADPCFAGLTNDDILRVARWLCEALTHHGAAGAAEHVELDAEAEPLLTHVLHADRVLDTILSFVPDAKTAASMAATCTVWSRAVMDDSHPSSALLWDRLLFHEFGVRVESVVPAKGQKPIRPNEKAQVARRLYRTMAKYRADCFRAEFVKERARQLQQLVFPASVFASGARIGFMQPAAPAIGALGWR